MTRSDSYRSFGSFREVVEFYLTDCRTPLRKAIDITIISMNLLVCAIFVVDTYDISKEMEILLWWLELFAVAFFIIEYVARLYGGPNRIKQLSDVYSVIDLVMSEITNCDICR